MKEHIDIISLFANTNIRAKTNKLLRSQIKTLSTDLATNVGWKELAKRLGVSYPTLWDIFNRSPNVPIDFLWRLCQEAGLDRDNRMKIGRSIEHLVYGRISGYRTAKANQYLTPCLAAIAGAIAADGYLYRTWNVFPCGRLGETSRIVVRDQDEDAIRTLCTWFNECFGLDVIPKKGHNHWYVSFNNKIVFQYINVLMGIPAGAKSRTVALPAIIEGSHDLERAFVQSLFLFDGGIDHRTGYVDFCLMSAPLISDTARILRSSGIEPDFISSNLDRNGWKIRIRRKAKLARFLQVFCIPNTKKYLQLASFIVPKPLLKDDLLKLFPRTRRGAVGYADVLDAVKRLENLGKPVNKTNMSIELGRGKTVIYEYLRRLDTLGLLKRR